MHTITIAAKNYLRRAVVLAESYREHNPADRFTILLVDATPDEFESTEGYAIVTPQDLPLDENEFRRMAMIYDVTELSTSVKPWALEMLLNDGAEVATYLDPDIVVYDSLENVERLARQDGIVLTPHTITPIPRDGLRPTEADIMSAGVYNLGFISVGVQSREILGWWQARLLRDSISAPHQMLFVDQRWIDLLPGYFDHAVLRDPGYNVAYWNLDSRKLERHGGRVTAGGAPLRFFHFSGYDPATPWILSKYVADNPRVVLSEHPVALELCDSYAAAIRAAEPDLLADVPYGFGALNDGTPLLASLRRVYRTALTDAELRDGERPPVPFVGDDSDVIEWFCEPVRPGRLLNRFLYGYWESRIDLRNAFSEPLGKDEQPLIEWGWNSVSRDPGIVEKLLPPRLVPDQAKTIATSEPGVNVAGYFRAELGVGQMGRLLVDGVQAAGLPFTTLLNRQTVSRQNAFFDETPSLMRYPIVVAAVNADQLPEWAGDLGPDELGDRYLIGMWAWEIETFVDYPKALELVDEIWTLSRFAQKAIGQATEKPVYVIPLPIPEPPPHHALDRDALGLPDGDYFLFMFDYMSVFERKNPLGVVAAFVSAFAEGEGPTLIIKSINGERHRGDRERLRQACAVRRDIVLIESYLDEDVLSSLMGDATAYVSLHRAEGYGLTMAEAMARSRPVIATGYSGNLDFMSESSSLLVPFELIPIAPGSGPYPSSSRWAEPDVAAAAKHMRWVVENPALALDLGRRAKDQVAEVGSVSRTASFISERIDAVMKTREAAVEKRQAHSRDSLAGATELIQTPHDVDTIARYPRAARPLRRGVLRVLAHHDEQTNQRLLALVSAIDQVRTQTAAERDALEAAIDKIRTQLTAEGRAFDAAIVAIQEDRVATAREQASSERENSRRQDELSTRYYDTAAVVDLHARQMEEVAARLDGLTAATAGLDAELEARPYSSNPGSLEVTGSDGAITWGYRGSASGESSYASFEDAFRGDREFIVERLRPYLPFVEGQAEVLDIGCGRGEFLELLRSEHVDATGVDLDESMLDQSRARGLQVANADGVEYLRELTPSSMGGVTSFQVVEHLEPERVRALFDAAYRALRPGGVLIAETVNPHSPAALKVFWLDLTHVRPLYPESLLFLARESGFTDAEIFFPHTTGSLSDRLRRSGEYALIAHK